MKKEIYLEIETTILKTINKSKPVLVTGANGYIGSWITKELLNNNCTVHATVRNISNKNKIKHLLEFSRKSNGKLKLFECDLLIKNSFMQAMQKCSIVFHTASPFKLNYKNANEELIKPALNGTENILNCANQIDSVSRIVITSSCAAMYTDTKELLNYENEEINENIWNKTASKYYNPYSYSKTIAEKKAWEIYDNQTNWDLVVLNPSFVLGPSLNSKFNTSESYNIIKQIIEGHFKFGIPKLPIGVIDVRDLAKAHYKVAFNPDSFGRYIVNSSNTNFYELSQLLYKNYGKKYLIPKKCAPKWITWLFGYFFNKNLTREYVSKNIGYEFKANNSRIKRELDNNFTPLFKTLEDTFKSIVCSN